MHPSRCPYQGNVSALGPREGYIMNCYFSENVLTRKQIKVLMRRWQSWRVLDVWLHVCKSYSSPVFVLTCVTQTVVIFIWYAAGDLHNQTQLL